MCISREVVKQYAKGSPSPAETIPMLQKSALITVASSTPVMDDG